MRFDNFQTKINSYKEDKKKKGRKPASVGEELDIKERLKRKLKEEEGYAGKIKKVSKYSGLKGTPNTRVEGSTEHGLYYDSKGILTSGTGHRVTSEEEAKKHFNLSQEDGEKLLDTDVSTRLKDINKAIPDYNNFRDELQDTIASSWFRGSIPGSPKTIKLINEGKYNEASKEFLNNAEYRNKKTARGVKERMKRTSDQLKKQADIKAKGLYYGGLPQQNREPASIEEQNMNEELGQKAALAKKKREEEELIATGKKIKDNVVEDVVNAPPVNDPSLTPNENEQVNTQKNNREAVKNSVDRNFETRDAKQGMGLKDQFLDALTFFGPQLLGGMLASGGKQDEYFVAGFNQGGKMRDAYLAQKNTEAKLELEREKKIKSAAFTKMDITPDFQTKTDGRPVWSRQNPKTGLPEFIDDTGKKYSATDVESMKAVQDEARQKSITSRQEVSLTERKIDRVQKTYKDMSTRKDISRLIEAEDTVAPVINLLESRQPISSKFLAPFIARGVQKEVGNLSETDLKNARVPLDIVNRVKSDFSGWISGDMSSEERAATVRLLSLMRQKNQEQLEEKISSYATESEAKRLGMDKQDLENDLRQRVGLEPKKVRKKVTITEKDIDNMSADELRRYLGE